MQQLTCKMVWSFSFYYLQKGLNFKKNPGGKILKNPKKCGKVRKSAEMILPFSCCHLVFLRVVPASQTQESEVRELPGEVRITIEAEILT